eukprot:4951695-Prymnesium_polylepis.1
MAHTPSPHAAGLWLVRAVGHRLPTEGLQLGLPPKLLVVRMGLHAGGQLGALRAVRLLLGVLRHTREGAPY